MLLTTQIIFTSFHLLATVLAWFALFKKDTRLYRWVQTVFFLGFVTGFVEVLWQIFISLRVGFLPLAGSLEVMETLGWVLLTIGFYVWVKFRSYLIAASLLLLASVASIAALLQLDKRIPYEGQLSAWLFVFHILILLFGIGSFCTAFFSGLLYLISKRELKAKKFGRFFPIFPPLEELDRLAVHSLVLGFFFLTGGIGTGIYLAHVFWHRDWLGDPKFIFSVVTWTWYLLLLWLRHQVGVRGGKFFALIVIGFTFLLFTFSISTLWGWPWT